MLSLGISRKVLNHVQIGTVLEGSVQKKKVKRLFKEDNTDVSILTKEAVQILQVELGKVRQR